MRALLRLYSIGLLRSSHQAAAFQSLVMPAFMTALIIAVVRFTSAFFIASDSFFWLSVLGWLSQVERVEARTPRARAMSLPCAPLFISFTAFAMKSSVHFSFDMLPLSWCRHTQKRRQP